MRDHVDDFLPFLASVDGEDMPGATDDGLMTPEGFAEYTHRVESTGEWGGEPEVSRTRKLGLTVDPSTVSRIQCPDSRLPAWTTYCRLPRRG